MSDDTAHRNVVYRLLPQRTANWRRLEGLLETQRQLYNAALQEREDCYRKTGKTITFYDQCKSLTECRRNDPKLAADPVSVQRGTLKRLDEAYRAFLRKPHTVGYPKFKGRRHFNSITFTARVRVTENRITLPVIGAMTVRRRGGDPSYADSPVLTATLRRQGGRWYVTVCREVPVTEKPDDGTAVGVDMNVGNVATSDRVIHRMPKVEVLEARKRRYERRVARRKPGSKRREKARALLNKTKRKITAVRKDWRHQTSRRIADSAHTVVVEALEPKKMSRSTKGTVDSPGKKVAQKRGLNRGIAETGWAQFREMLRYKADLFIEVNPAYTSQRCAACGHVDRESRRGEKFNCVSCGHADHADLNAAANILASGTGASARGGAFRSRTPMSREISARIAA